MKQRFSSLDVKVGASPRPIAEAACLLLPVPRWELASSRGRPECPHPSLALTFTPPLPPGRRPRARRRPRLPSSGKHLRPQHPDPPPQVRQARQQAADPHRVGLPLPPDRLCPHRRPGPEPVRRPPAQVPQDPPPHKGLPDRHRPHHRVPVQRRRLPPVPRVLCQRQRHPDRCRPQDPHPAAQRPRGPGTGAPARRPDVHPREPPELWRRSSADTRASSVSPGDRHRPGCHEKDQEKGGGRAEEGPCHDHHRAAAGPGRPRLSPHRL